MTVALPWTACDCNVVACVVAVTQDNSRLIVYGGYSKERVKRDVDRGQIHTDMFALTFDSKFDLSSSFSIPELI